MFVLIYGIQIMQGVIDEKTSKVVEVIVSSVKPFQLMLGKIIGIASVGLLQFTIWIILISVLSSGTLAYFGLKMPQKQMMEQVTKQMDNNPEMKEAVAQQNSKVTELLGNLNEIPFTKIAFVFVFYFLGGYLLYGALFAAVGSVIPFTSPVAMVGRIAFGVPAWELALSMVLLIGGFLLTTWIAGRIYRVGILASGTKVSYKVLAKWFMMKN
jgi:ABC-2 type transport system permease protein